jgi:uncharacterized membrane protein
MDLKETVSKTAETLEVLGATTISLGIAFSVIGFLVAYFVTKKQIDHYRQLRVNIGKSILLGLEVLVAADIIATIVVSPNLRHVGALAIVILVRSLLSFSLEIEMTGRVPWKSGRP